MTTAALPVSPGECRFRIRTVETKLTDGFQPHWLLRRLALLPMLYYLGGFFQYQLMSQRHPKAKKPDAFPLSLYICIFVYEVIDTVIVQIIKWPREK